VIIDPSLWSHYLLINYFIIYSSLLFYFMIYMILLYKSGLLILLLIRPCLLFTTTSPLIYLTLSYWLYILPTPLLSLIWYLFASILFLIWYLFLSILFIYNYIFLISLRSRFLVPPVFLFRLSFLNIS